MVAAGDRPSTEDAAGTDLERRLRLIVDAAPNAIVVVDREGRVAMASRKACQILGGEAMLAMPLKELLPEWGTGTAEHLRNAHLDPPGRRLSGGVTEMNGWRLDGRGIRVRVGVTQIANGDEHFFLVSISDLGEHADSGPDEQRSLVDSVPFSVIETDPAGVIVSANTAACHLLGHPRHALVGRPVSVIDPAAHGVEEELAELLAARSGTERERQYERSDGTTVPVTEGVVRLYDEGGATTGYLATAYDITKHRHAQAAVLFMANHDTLTNLPNRSMLVRHLVGAIGRAKAEGGAAALVLLDLDHFKRVNDSLGHHAGDILLLRVADRLKRWRSGAEIVARLGGDEFVVVFTGVEDVASLTDEIRGLLRALSAPVAIQGTELTVTVSAGGVLCPHDADDPAALLRLADTAMYHAKASGRNGFAWFAEPMLEVANERTSIASELRSAMRSDQLSIAYQPQIALGTGEVVGFEALLRWRSPVHGQIGPDRFIPVAEESGMIVELGSWVLDRACRDLAEMQRVIGRPLRLAVNCSPRQLHHEDCVDTVLAALSASGLAGDQLELEITEGVLMDDRWDVLSVLQALRAHGVSIAIDDFGQGYSSLAYLTRFPINRLKIDRAFVQKLEAGTQAPIVDAIIGMAHALGMEVVAEGVENHDQARYLRTRGCEEAQGFLFSRAVPLDEAIQQARAGATGVL